jgi:hypothetical protein
MKKIFYTTILLIGLSTAAVVAQGPVRLTIKDGIDGNIKSRIEKTATELLTEINAAYTQKRALNTVGLNMSEEARKRLAAFWENCRFYCDADNGKVVELCLHTWNGFQIRNIPLMLHPRANVQMQDDVYQEVVISFDKTGRIISFDETTDLRMWQNVMKNGDFVTDQDKITRIEGFVNHFKTAYNEKDLEYLNKIFSEDALIITGTVIKTRKTDAAINMPTEKIKYTKKSKKEYIAALKESFSKNEWIEVRFNDLKVEKHPKYNDVYGVTVFQSYSNSIGYSDEGYVFMLWDFRNMDDVQIHVRTWQPKWLDEERTKELPKDKLFRVSEFSGFRL